MLFKIFALLPIGFDSGLSKMCGTYSPDPPATDG